MNIISGEEICKLSNRINLNLMYFGNAQIKTDWQGSVISPAYSRLYYISAGSAEIFGSGEKITLTPGRWYFFPTGYSFNFSFPQNMEHIYFHFKLCDVDNIDLLRFIEKPCILENEDDISDIISRLSSYEVADAIYIKQYIYSLISKIAKIISAPVGKDYSPCLLRALQYINNNLTINITIDEIAAAAYTSKSTLTKKFRNELSMSVNEYVSDAVLSEAARRLMSKDESVLSVSERYGFSDQFYFSRKFKQKYGTSPREYRKNKLL